MVTATVPLPPPPPPTVLGPLQAARDKAASNRRTGRRESALLRFMWHPTTEYSAFALPGKENAQHPTAECNAGKRSKSRQKERGCSSAKCPESREIQCPAACGRAADRAEGRGYVIVTGLSNSSGESKGGFLAKRASNSAGDTLGAKVKRAANSAERDYVPIEDDPTAAGGAPEGAADAAASESAKPSMHEVFGPGGFLEKCMLAGFDRTAVSSDYEYRPGQLELAEMVHDASESPHHAIVEAGTRTGQSLAYLLPAICSGRRVVISTTTKSLQEQLYQKDIPFLQKHFAPNLKVAVMKGRSNFLCISKLNQMQDQALLKGMEEMDAFRQIADWAKLTETGDRAELTFLPDDSELWGKLDARRDTCTGKNCPSFNPCFLTGMHQRAQEADLIIVNHHLFFADLALKQDDFGSILPGYSAVVFDEAHEMEDVASDYFGRQISNYRFEELARDGRYGFERNEREAFLEQHREGYDALAMALKGLETEFAALAQKPGELLRIARRSFEIRQELAFLFESNERNFVYWYERRGKGVFLAATPIDVSQILRARLFEQFDTIVLTSATLTVAGRFEYIRQRLGLDHAKEGALPPEFDWGNQALFYMPRNMPDVRNPAFSEAAADEIVKLLELSEGRAFCLFTSYSQMNDLFERVRGRVSFPLLLQGTAPRSALLERFKNTPGAVLFATSSFWQGVDVPGEQLSCVIVDRLPFAVPSDPIVAARV